MSVSRIQDRETSIQGSKETCIKFLPVNFFLIGNLMKSPLGRVRGS